MWIVVGRILCKIAKVTGHRKLYIATRHTFRSGCPGLFQQYWWSYPTLVDSFGLTD